MARRSNDRALNNTVRIVRANQNKTIYLDEDLSKFTSAFRTKYYSSSRLRFKEWCKTVSNLLDDLT